MRQEEVKELLKKYSAGTANAEEKALVEAWYEQYQTQEQIINEAHLQSIEDEVFNRLPIIQEKPVRRLWPRIAAAASVLIMLSIGGYFVFHRQNVQETAQVGKNDIAPGHKQVTLTLANGQQIAVNNKVHGQLATQGGMVVQVNNGNALAYSPTVANASKELQYNTLSTTRGEESPFPVELSDGSKIWLNAASSITYPVAFVGKDRVVKITGEVYFEVAHNPKKPFKVIANGQTIEDIGTSFNVNAYNDEPLIRTTLVEGSIKLLNNTGSAILKPGQQAVVAQTNQSIKLQDADIEEVLAWRNGNFIFNHENIQSIMRKVSRWYDVEVVYEEGVSTDWVGGSESRFKNVSEVLHKLELTGQFHFRIEGKKIIVTK